MLTSASERISSPVHITFFGAENELHVKMRKQAIYV